MKKIHIILLAVGAGIIAILFLFRGSSESDAPKMIYSKEPVDIEGKLTVTINENTNPNSQTDQLDLKSPSLQELIKDPNATINWTENSNKKKAEQIK